VRTDRKRESDRRYYASQKGRLNRARKCTASYETRLRRLAEASGHWVIIPRVWGDGMVDLYRYGRNGEPSVRIMAASAAVVERYLSDASGLRIAA
jgi:hypothetical protein